MLGTGASPYRRATLHREVPATGAECAAAAPYLCRLQRVRISFFPDDTRFSFFSFSLVQLPLQAGSTAHTGHKTNIQTLSHQCLML